MNTYVRMTMVKRVSFQSTKHTSRILLAYISATDCQKLMLAGNVEVCFVD